MKIGVTTGFTKVMVAILLEDAAKQGFIPDSSVAGDEVPNGLGWRPAPFSTCNCRLSVSVFMYFFLNVR